jgi:hypothetical protein
MLLPRLARPVQKFFDARASRRRVCTQILRGPAFSKAVTGLWRKASGAAALWNPLAASPTASGGQQQQGREAKEIRWGGPVAGLGWPRWRWHRRRRETGALPVVPTLLLLDDSSVSLANGGKPWRDLQRSAEGRFLRQGGATRIPAQAGCQGVKGHGGTAGPPSPVRPAGLSERCAVATALSNR